MMEPVDIERVRDATSIVDLIGSYVALKKAGKEYRGLCPFHDDHHASLTVSPNKEIFMCFPCQTGGDVFNFVMHYEKVNFPEAVQLLADRAHIQIQSAPEDKARESVYQVLDAAAKVYQETLKKNSKILEYIRSSRRITDESSQTFRIGFAPDNWDFISHELNATQELLEKAACGRVRKNKFGKLVVIDRELDDAGRNELADYVRSALPRVFSSARNLSNDLRHVFKDRMMFVDIETCGLSYSDPIFLIGMLKYQKDKELKFRILAARNYPEEPAILGEFARELEDYEAVFTFNGTSFDLPRITERARQHAVPLNGKSKSLAEILGPRHIDLLPLAKRGFRLPDSKLSTVEKMLGFERVHDTSGRNIPKTYERFVSTGDPRRMSDVIEHNFLDVLSMLALFLRLSKQK